MVTCTSLYFPKKIKKEKETSPFDRSSSKIILQRGIHIQMGYICGYCNLPPLYSWSHLMSITFAFQFTPDLMNQGPGVGPCNMYFNKLHWWFWFNPEFENHALLNMALLGTNLKGQGTHPQAAGNLGCWHSCVPHWKFPQHQGPTLPKVRLPISMWSMTNNWLTQGYKYPNSCLKLGQLQRAFSTPGFSMDQLKPQWSPHCKLASLSAQFYRCNHGDIAGVAPDHLQ